MAILPQVRLGRKSVTTAQIMTVVIPLGYVAGLCAVAVARQLRTLPVVQAFMQTYPGTGSFSRPVESGFPWWLRSEHYLNLLFMLFMIRSGLQILADHSRLYLDGNCTRVRFRPCSRAFPSRIAVAAEVRTDDAALLHSRLVGHCRVGCRPGLGDRASQARSAVRRLLLLVCDDTYKIEHMHHEICILAYAMNGQRLSELHGAPLGLRNELELGFKQVEWVQDVEFAESFKQLGSGEGGFNEDNE
ncbi:MAG: molybdopterin-dependent oxidoreductase [Chloroflexi bacterium]|nr:molybdopterin-dependent oxidoreductase [Chloroflexota bacterium]